MKIAYLILAHTNPQQLRRLLCRLNSEHMAVFIHLDLKTMNMTEFLGAVQGIPNASLIRHRTDVKWGAYSLVEAILRSLQEIVDSRVEFDYVHLMSGSDYPIRDTASILNFFEQNRGREFIHYRPLPIAEFYEGRMDRVWYYYDFDNVHSPFGSPNDTGYEAAMRQRGLKRSFIQGMKPYHGSTWWCLTRDCIRYILHKVGEDNEIANYFRYTRVPDEQFFQTLVMNSPYASNAPGENLWYLDWTHGEDPMHPKTLDPGDFPALSGSSCLYARKFNIFKDAGILDMIDRQLLQVKPYQG